MAEILGIKITAQDATGSTFKTVTQGLGGIQNAAIQVSTAMASLGVAFSAGAMVAYAKSIVDGIDALNDLKDATGSSIENISALEDVARRSGASLDTVSTSLVKLNKSLNSAKPGSGAEQAITAIGLSVKDLKNLDPAEAFRRIAVSLNGFADDVNKAYITEELFGKSLKEVAPLLKDLAGQGRLVATVTTEQAEAAEKFNKELFNMSKNVQDVIRYLIGDFITGVNAAAKAWRESGLTAAVQTLFTGDDQHKNNVALVEQTNELLTLERDIANLRQTSVALDAALVRKKEERLKILKEEIKTTQAYRAVLADQAAPVNDAPKPSLKPLPNSATVKAAQDAARKALAEQNRELEAQARLLAELSGLSGSFAEDWKRLSDIYASDKINLEQLTQAQADLLAKQPAIKAAADDQKKAQELLAKSYADTLKEVEKYQQAQQALVVSSFDEVEKAQAAFDAHGKLASVIAQETLARLELDRTIMAGTGSEDLSVIDAQISNKKRLIDILQKGEVRQAGEDAAKAGEDAAKATKDAYDKYADQIGQSLTDQIMEGGRNGAEYLQNLFRTMVLRPIVQAIVSPVAGAVTSALVGSTGSSGMLGSAGSMGSGLFGSGTSTFGTFGGSGSLDIFGYSAGEIMGGMGVISGLYSLSQGKTGAGLGALIGTAILPGIGSVIGSVLGGIFDSNTISAADSGRARIDYTAAGVGGAATNTTGDATQIAAFTKSTDTLAQSYFNTAKNLGIKAIAGAFEIGANTGKEGANPMAVFGFSGGGASYSSGEVSSTDNAAMSLAASRTILTALKSSELPAWLAGVFDDLTPATATQEQITATLGYATAIDDFHDALQTLPWEPLKNMAFATTDALADFSGGLDNLRTNLGTFYSNFYSADEQAGFTRQSIVSTVNAAGGNLSVDQLEGMTRNDWRTLVEESMGDTSTKGLQLTSTLLGVSGAFASITPAAETAADAVKRIGSAAMDAVTKAVDAEKAAVTKAYDAQAAAIQAALDPVAESIGKLQSLSDTLKSTLDSMKFAGSDSLRRIDAQAQISAALSTARAGGGLPLDGQLNNALSTVAQPSDKLFADFESYAKDFYRTANDVTALSDLTGKQLTADELTQDLLQAQLDNAKTEFDTTITYLDAQAEMAQQMYDVANGTYEATLSVADAITALQEALKPGSTGTAKPGVNGSGTSAGDSDFQAGPSSNGATSWAGQMPEWAVNLGIKNFNPSPMGLSGAPDQSNQYNTGGVSGSNFAALTTSAGADAFVASHLPSLAQQNADRAAQGLAPITRTAAQIAESERYYRELYASQHATYHLAVGTNYVPYDGFKATLHEGEEVVPRAWNPAAGGRAAGNEAMMAKFDAMIARLERIESTNADIASSTRGTDKTLTFVTKGGTTMQTDMSGSVLTL